MCLSSESLLFYLKGADFKSPEINNLSKNYKHVLHMLILLLRQNIKNCANENTNRNMHIFLDTLSSTP